MIPLEVRKHDVRRWQIGPYDIILPNDVDDTENEAWRAGLIALHSGEHQYAATYKVASYVWMIEGHKVVLPQSADGVSLPDSEEQARATLLATMIQTT